jgi:hypothetical protein
MMILLISTVELARGMWTYNTLAHALRDATRYVIVHGNNCANIPNRCAVRIQDIARKIQFAGLGLDPASLQNIEFRSSTRTVTCATLSACLTDTTYWPTNTPCVASPCPSPDTGATRLFDLEIRAKYSYESILLVFWPGSHARQLGTFWLAATSKERIQF